VKALLCSTSLWSADLANLERDVRRIAPFSDRFHFDVIDGQYLPALLFFPDLVRAVRPYTELPFEVHLMTSDPAAWIEPFAEAGAEIIICQVDTLRQSGAAVDVIRGAGLKLGVALSLDDRITDLDPYWPVLDVITVIGTPLGVKGADFSEHALETIHAARAEMARRGHAIEIQVDGGIRRSSVPLIHAAGADSIVPGSLMFGGDPAELRDWLASL
jgi:ribulose-phosphate 3-epimerase